MGKHRNLSGMGLNDSPMGLAGYILEKFSTWTNRVKVAEFPKLALIHGILLSLLI